MHKYRKELHAGLNELKHQRFPPFHSDNRIRRLHQRIYQISSLDTDISLSAYDQTFQLHRYRTGISCSIYLCRAFFHIRRENFRYKWKKEACNNNAHGALSFLPDLLSCDLLQSVSTNNYSNDGGHKYTEYCTV